MVKVRKIHYEIRILLVLPKDPLVKGGSMDSSSPVMGGEVGQNYPTLLNFTSSVAGA